MTYVFMTCLPITFLNDLLLRQYNLVMSMEFNSYFFRDNFYCLNYKLI